MQFEIEGYEFDLAVQRFLVGRWETDVGNRVRSELIAGMVDAPPLTTWNRSQKNQCTVRTMQTVVAAGKFIDLRRLAWLMDRAIRINIAKCDLTKTMAYQQNLDGLRTGASLNGMVRCYSLWRLGCCGNLVFGAVEGLSLAQQQRPRLRHQFTRIVCFKAAVEGLGGDRSD